MTDFAWKVTIAVGLLYLMFPFFVMTCFVLMIVYVSAANCTGCFKKK